jgi:hypothetical protein
MCWSGEASGTLAAIGLSTAVYLAKKGEPKELWIPLTYFALMEVLQAATYVYIDDCANPMNQVLTLFGYLHIAFQPFFVNMVAMYFIPAEVKQRIYLHVYALCAVGAIAMLVKMFPFDWAGFCYIGKEAFCGATPCSVSGDWHIAWQLPLNGILSYPVDYIFGITYGLHSIVYILIGFYLPALYGSWRFMLFHWVGGPMLSNWLTTNPNEFAAVWCLFSIGLCVSVIKTPLRRFLRVETWFFYGRVREQARALELAEQQES